MLRLHPTHLQVVGGSEGVTRCLPLRMDWVVNFNVKEGWGCSKF